MFGWTSLSVSPPRPRHATRPIRTTAPGVARWGRQRYRVVRGYSPRKLGCCRRISAAETGSLCKYKESSPSSSMSSSIARHGVLRDAASLLGRRQHNRNHRNEQEGDLRPIVVLPRVRESGVSAWAVF